MELLTPLMEFSSEAQDGTKLGAGVGVREDSALRAPPVEGFGETVASVEVGSCLSGSVDQASMVEVPMLQLGFQNQHENTGARTRE